MVLWNVSLRNIVQLIPSTRHWSSISPSWYIDCNPGKNPVVYHDFPWNLPRVVVSLSYYIPSYHHHILILLVFKTLTYIQQPSIIYSVMSVLEYVFSYCILLYYIWLCYIPIKWVLTSMFDGRISHRLFVSMTSDRGRLRSGTTDDRSMESHRNLGKPGFDCGIFDIGKGISMMYHVACLISWALLSKHASASSCIYTPRSTEIFTCTAHLTAGAYVTCLPSFWSTKNHKICHPANGGLNNPDYNHSVYMRVASMVQNIPKYPDNSLNQMWLPNL